MAALPAPDPTAEARHPSEPVAHWNESWYFDWTDPAGERGGYVRIGLYPTEGVCWYWACSVAIDEPLVTIIDHTVALPTAGGSLELRGTGLWADHLVAEPLERWSLDLEAFGLRLDDPTDAYDDEPRGERVPFGFELEWETDGAAYQYPEPLERYEIPCRVRGTVQVGEDAHPVDGWGQRDHSWGVRDWWLLGHVWMAVRLDDGTRVHTSVPIMEGLDWAAGYVQSAGGEHVEVRSGVVLEESDGPAGLHGPLRAVVGDVDMVLTPVAWSPVPMDSADGRRALLPRALVQVACADGRSGVGWMERNMVVRSTPFGS